MKRSLIRIVSILLAVSLMVCSFVGCNKEEPETPDESTGTTAPVEESTSDVGTAEIPENLNPLTGISNLSESAIAARPIAIMVENSPAARPQWGITTPDIVVEGVAEGGITRMMWIYADANKIPEKVGPVRSARHDFVELAKGMNAIFVHWGASDGSGVGFQLGYQAIRNLGVNNIDGKKYEGSYFFRDNTRNTAIEHRGITTQTAVKNAISKLGYTTKANSNNWQPFDVAVDGQDITSINTTNCSQISVTFSTGFTHTFKYDTIEKRYYNYLNNKVMTDGNNGKSMAVENVIVLYVPVTTLNTGAGHKEWNWDIGSGEGYYVSNGVGQEITWSKAGKSEPLKIQDMNNNELVINPGQSWIGVVPAGNKGLTTVQ